MDVSDSFTAAAEPFPPAATAAEARKASGKPTLAVKLQPRKLGVEEANVERALGEVADARRTKELIRGVHRTVLVMWFVLGVFHYQASFARYVVSLSLE